MKRTFQFREFSSVSIAMAIVTLAVCASQRAHAADPPEKLPAAQTEPKAAPKRVAQAADGSILLHAKDVSIHGSHVRYEPDKNTIGYWTRAEDWVSWDLSIKQPGKFEIEMLAACGQGSGDSRYTLAIGNQTLEDKVPDTGSFRTFRLRKIGVVQIDKPGDYTLSVRPTSKPGLAVMDLRDVVLKPVKPEASPLKLSIPNPPGINRGEKPAEKPAP